jgi:hypothetical protein
MSDEDKSRVETNAEERRGPLGDQQETEPQSIPTEDEDEDQYTIRLTVHPASVPGLPLSLPSMMTDSGTEDWVWGKMHEDLGTLGKVFQAAADRASEPELSEVDPSRVEPSQPTVRLYLRDLHITKGSITLIAIFGAVYAGVKDYDALRKGLLQLAEDMKQLLRRDLSPVLPRWWAIDSEVMVETRPPLPQSAGASETRADAPTAEVQTALRQPGRRGFNWDAQMTFIHYLAITNVAVILFLGFLLVRASS